MFPQFIGEKKVIRWQFLNICTQIFYFILEDRLVPKAILCHTKRRQRFIFSSAMLQMIKYKSMKFSNKIKIKQDRKTEKSHFKLQNTPFIDVIILLLVSQIL